MTTPADIQGLPAVFRKMKSVVLDLLSRVVTMEGQVATLEGQGYVFDHMSARADTTVAPADRTITMIDIDAGNLPLEIPDIPQRMVGGVAVQTGELYIDFSVNSALVFGGGVVLNGAMINSGLVTLTYTGTTAPGLAHFVFYGNYWHFVSIAGGTIAETPA